MSGGSGPAVVLLHGFPETWYTWRDVLPGLAASHRVIALDLPGVGCSSTAPGYDADTMARTVHDVVVDRGLSQVAVVGHDTGGWVAFSYARQYRDAVTHLVLSGAAIPGYGLEDLLDFRTPDSGLPHLVLFSRQPDQAERLILADPHRYFADFVTSDAVHRSGVLDDDVRWYTRPGRMRAALAQYEALYRDAQDNRSGLGSLLTMPTMALSGSDVQLSTEGLRRVARDVNEVSLPAGHYAQEDVPDRYAEALLRFLG